MHALEARIAACYPTSLAGCWSCKCKPLRRRVKVTHWIRIRIRNMDSKYAKWAQYIGDVRTDDDAEAPIVTGSDCSVYGEDKFNRAKLAANGTTTLRPGPQLSPCS
jgi:hypothetical protein